MTQVQQQVDEYLDTLFDEYKFSSITQDNPGGFQNGVWHDTVQKHGREVDRDTNLYLPNLEKGVQAELEVQTRGFQRSSWQFPVGFDAVNHHLLLTFSLGRELKEGDPVSAGRRKGVVKSKTAVGLCRVAFSDGEEEENWHVDSLSFCPTLSHMSAGMPTTYHCPWIFASMLMFSKEHVCTANFSGTLKMVVVGGYTKQQVKDSVEHFVGRVQTSLLRLWDAPLVLSKISLNNVLFRNKIPGQSIEVQGITDLAKRMGWSYRYTSLQINKLVLNPFPKTKSSITCVIMPTGGVNITGVKSYAEQKMAQQFLERFISQYLRPQPAFSPDTYFREREIANKNAKQRALQRRDKKIKKWEAVVQNAKNDGTYSRWFHSNDHSSSLSLESSSSNTRSPACKRRRD